MKKIPKDVQKRRRNFRLKKMLTPKPPMMVLFELVNHADIQFQPFIVDPVSYSSLILLDNAGVHVFISNYEFIYLF